MQQQINQPRIYSWDIWEANLEGICIANLGKKRPVLVLSYSAFNNAKNQPTVLIAPISKTPSSNKSPLGAPVIVPIKKNICGLTEDSYILIDTLVSLEKSRLIRKRGNCPETLKGPIQLALIGCFFEIFTENQIKGFLSAESRPKPPHR